MLQVIAISSLRDNYIWAIYHAKSNQCLIVDPGDARAVLLYLTKHSIELSAILITHYHWDHIDGVAALKKCFPNVAIYGPALENTAGEWRPLYAGNQLSLLDNQCICLIYEIPGHTKGHIAYYMQDIEGNPAVFTGDTLFSGGCGRLLEGSPYQLYQSLLKLKSLPLATRVYCGHEYTVNNLQFAYWLEPDNEIVQIGLTVARHWRMQHIPTLPTTLQKECSMNPFLRCDEPAFIKQMRKRFTFSQPITPLALFTHLRQKKDHWQAGKENI